MLRGLVEIAWGLVLGYVVDMRVWLTTVLAALCGACHPGGVAMQVPWIEGPDLIFFEDAPVGEISQIEVELYNSGTGTADLSFSVLGPFEVPVSDKLLKPERGFTLLVFYEPVAAGKDSGELRIQTGVGVLTIDIEATAD